MRSHFHHEVQCSDFTTPTLNSLPARGREAETLAAQTPQDDGTVVVSPKPDHRWPYEFIQSAHFGGSSVPQGIRGTLEVEFFGEPSMGRSE